MELNQDEIRLKTIKAKKMMLLFCLLSISMTFAGDIVSEAGKACFQNCNTAGNLKELLYKGSFS